MRFELNVDGQVLVEGRALVWERRYPTGMGTVEFQQAGDDILVIRYSQNGNKKFDVRIRSAGIWSVESECVKRFHPPEETCQYRRIFKRLGLPPCRLIRHEAGQTVKITGKSMNPANQLRGNFDAFVRTDGEQPPIVNGAPIERVSNCLETPWEATITGAAYGCSRTRGTVTWAVEAVKRENLDRQPDKALMVVHIWGEKVDVAALENWLLEFLHGPGFTADFLEARAHDRIHFWLRGNPMFVPGPNASQMSIGGDLYVLNSSGWLSQVNSNCGAFSEAVALCFNGLCRQQRVTLLPVDQWGYVMSLAPQS